MTQLQYNIARAYRAGTEGVGFQTIITDFPESMIEDVREAYYRGYEDSINEMESALDSHAFDGVMYDETGLYQPSATMQTTIGA